MIRNTRGKRKRTYLWMCIQCQANTDRLRCQWLIRLYNSVKDTTHGDRGNKVGRTLKRRVVCFAVYNIFDPQVGSRIAMTGYQSNSGTKFIRYLKFWCSYTSPFVCIDCTSKSLACKEENIGYIVRVWGRPQRKRRQHRLRTASPTRIIWIPQGPPPTSTHHSMSEIRLDT